jgi:hypothetical protein
VACVEQRSLAIFREMAQAEDYLRNGFGVRSATVPDDAQGFHKHHIAGWINGPDTLQLQGKSA